MISVEELAWAAGLFDGEGSVGLYPANRSRGHHLVVTVANCHVPTLERFVEWFGGSIYRTNPHDSKRRPIYQWQLSGKEKMADFLYQIHPYSVTKRLQIWIAAEWLALRTRARRCCAPLTAEELQIDQKMAVLLKQAKKAETE
jgi:hypothetical protein